MKKIDSLILRSFLFPFLATLLLSSFVLLMQFMWKYIDELVGKGLQVAVLAEFIFYGWVVSLPLALPLSILLSSIMSFGNLSEHFELVAIKASGISLLRAMRTLIFASVLLAIGAFYFTNWILPVVNLKFQTLRFEIGKKMPTINMTPGQFYNELEGYSIRVGAKDKTGREIYDVLLYDHSSGRGNDQVISAEKGELYMTADTNYLVLKLMNGKRYEEIPAKGAEKKYEQMRMYFKEYEKKFDLSDMKLQKMDESVFEDHYKMMSARQLQNGIDSLKREVTRKSNKVAYLTQQKLLLTNDSLYAFKPVAVQMQPTSESILDEIDTAQQLIVLKNAQSIARSIKSANMDAMNSQEIVKLQTRHYMIEWHRKYTFPFGCIVLFFIGAPFGAIIRKGGLGLPMIFSVVFFMIYHVLNTIGQKLATDESLSPMVGMWIASFILLPIGIYFTVQAINDSQIFNADVYNRFYTRVKKIITRKNA